MLGLCLWLAVFITRWLAIVLIVLGVLALAGVILVVLSVVFGFDPFYLGHPPDDNQNGKSRMDNHPPK